MKAEDILKRLRLEFVAMWLLAAALAICYETGLFTDGSCVGDATTAYILEAGAILLTLVAIPAALKISGRFMYSRIVRKSGTDIAGTVLRWSEIQVFILTIAVITDISIYYATLESLGMLCAAIGLIASLLCFPNRNRIQNYLNTSKSEQQ